MHMPSFSERDFLSFTRTRASCGPTGEQKNDDGNIWPEKTSQRAVTVLPRRHWPFLNPTNIPQRFPDIPPRRLVVIHERIHGQVVEPVDRQLSLLKTAPRALGFPMC